MDKLEALRDSIATVAALCASTQNAILRCPLERRLEELVAALVACEEKYQLWPINNPLTPPPAEW